MRQHGCAARLSAPYKRTHPRFELGKIERLDHVIVGSEVQTLYAILQRVARSQHQNRNVGAAPPHPPQHLESVEPRQTDVENHEVVRLRGEHVIGIHAVRRVVDRVVGLAQRACEAVSQHGVVFYDQDPHASDAADSVRRSVSLSHGLRCVRLL